MNDFAFAGFVPPTKNYFHMPNVWIDICAEIKNLAELKVVQYVLRHTWGFREYGVAKAISVDEFMHGRRLANGKRMDKGTGLSNHSVIDGLKAAIKHGFLVCEIDTSDLARVKKSYALRMFLTGEESSPPATSTPPVNDAPGEESTASSEDSSPSYEESSHRSEKDTKERHLEKDTKSAYNAADKIENQSANAQHTLADAYVPDYSLPQKPTLPEVEAQREQVNEALGRLADPIATSAQTAPENATGYTTAEQTTLTAAVRRAAARTQEKKTKKTEYRIFFTTQGAAVRNWYEEAFDIKLDETPALAVACNVLGKRESVTRDNMFLVRAEIKTNRWAKSNNICPSPQDLASTEGVQRWEKWLLPALDRAAKAKPPTREENPYSLAALIEEQNPGYFEGAKQWNNA